MVAPQSQMHLEITISGHSSHEPSLHDEQSPENEETGLKLARFAYSKPTSVAIHNHKRARVKSLPVAPELVNEQPKKRSRQKSRVEIDFRAIDIGKLLRCVACGAKWTTRKTAAQKEKHMLSCARKNSLTGQDLSTLINKELESTSAASNQALRTEVAQTSPSAVLVRETYFEDIVHEAAPKKRAKRALRFNITPVQDAHETIRRRAREMFGTLNQGQVDSYTGTQTLAAHKLDLPFEIQKPTSVSTDSSLGPKLPRRKRSFASTEPKEPLHHASNGPLTTPKFSPSRLAVRTRISVIYSPERKSNEKSRLLSPLTQENTVSGITYVISGGLITLRFSPYNPHTNYNHHPIAKAPVFLPLNLRQQIHQIRLRLRVLITQL